MRSDAMRRPDHLLCRVVTTAAVLAAVRCALFTSGAYAKPACAVAGPRWTHYEAHGGANPKLDASGTLYYVNLIGYSCAAQRPR